MEANIQRVDAVYEMPTRATNRTAPRGLVFLAHGCSHRATDFWPHSPSCPSCIGLPEEVAIARAVVDADYAAVALSSRGHCWDFDVDASRVASALTSFIAEHRLERLPRYALGASSGGAFVLQLPKLFALDAVVSQIMAVPAHLLPHKPPPLLFVHMPRDTRTAALVHRCVRFVRQHRGGRSEKVEAQPLPINASFFARRIRGVSLPTSAALHRALLPALDESGMLLEDPRGSDWRRLVETAPGGLAGALPGARPGEKDSLEADQSAVAEELNVAWASHEITSDYMGQTLEWFAQTQSASPTPRQVEL